MGGGSGGLRNNKLSNKNHNSNNKNNKHIYIYIYIHVWIGGISFLLSEPAPVGFPKPPNIATAWNLRYHSGSLSASASPFSVQW